MTWDDEFRFRCHAEIDCYNTCCCDVNIFLNPLDIMRLRTALGVNSTVFLETYTHKLVSQTTGMPAVALKMSKDAAKSCPFVTAQGCSVYESRPYSCRLYPLDTKDGIEFRMTVSPDVCHGLQEHEAWTVELWRKEQGLYYYDDPDRNLKDVMNPDRVWESKIADPRMQDMILLSFYDPDKFRKFIFESSFLRKFKIDNDILDKVREDDLALLYFAGHWMRFALFGKIDFLNMDKDYLEEKKKETLEKKRL